MKNLHNILMEVAAPQSPADKEFVALHATQKKQFVDYPESQFKGTPEKDETKLAHPSKETGHDEHVEKEKPVSEETFEGLVEQNLMEISKKVLGNYINKASVQVANATERGTRERGYYYDHSVTDPDRSNRHYDASEKLRAHADKRLKGIRKATAKLTKEEYEDLQELSKQTLGSYVSKANREMSLNAYSRGLRADDRREDDHVAKLQKKSDKRQSGINTALRKLTK